jgi:hypothetical protein
VQGDEIGAPEQLGQVYLFDAEIDCTLGRQERIIGNHLHAQPDRTISDDRADIAAADHPQCLGGDFNPHEPILLPLAGLCGRIGLRNLARQRQHQGDGMLGCRD